MYSDFLTQRQLGRLVRVDGEDAMVRRVRKSLDSVEGGEETRKTL
jgi:hypothetical protein